MQSKGITSIAAVAAGLTIAIVLSGAPARAQDFFSSLFGGFTQPRHASTLPFADPADETAPPPQRVAAGPAKAYCVRTCDGRYFPLGGTGNESKAETCQSLCPASATKVVFGHDIDSATTDGGKPYSALPNAFRYRTELVNGCTCNGRTPGGLAHIDIKSDPTLRRGDLIATADGSLVTNGGKSSRLSMKTSPARTERGASRFTNIPVMAAQ